MTNKGKVIWAIEPFAKERKLQLATFKALSKLTQGMDVSIEPVTVLSPNQIKVPLEAFRGQKKEYELKAETVIKSWLKSLKSPKLVSPTLLVQDAYSTHGATEILLKYARETGATLIALGAHNKKTFDRFVLGSFAETMILKSDVPTLIVNPKNPVPPRISRILFPTDFSETSRLAFRKLLPEAKAIGAKIVLYYKFEYVVAETVYAMSLMPAYSQFLKDDLEGRASTSKQWVEEASQNGVKVEVILDEKPGYISDGIIKAVKKSKANLVAMASHSGAVTSVLIGSVARQIVRMSPVPVWVIHPSKEGSSARLAKTQPRPTLLA